MTDIQGISRFFEETPTAVLVTDAEGLVEYVNPHFAKLTGFTNSEISGEHFSRFARPTQEQEEQAWSELSQGRAWRGAGQGMRRDGTMFKAYVAVSPVKSPEGEVTHYLALAANLTDGHRRRAGPVADDTAPKARELTKREREVFALVAQGLPDLEIAERLTVSVRTVNRHVSDILRKLGAANRTRAVYLAGDLIDGRRRTSNERGGAP